MACIIPNIFNFKNGHVKNVRVGQTRQLTQTNVRQEAGCKLTLWRQKAVKQLTASQCRLSQQFLSKKWLKCLMIVKLIQNMKLCVMTTVLSVARHHRWLDFDKLQLHFRMYWRSSFVGTNNSIRTLHTMPKRNYLGEERQKVNNIVTLTCM